jgi:hypothetical protein
MALARSGGPHPPFSENFRRDGTLHEPILFCAGHVVLNQCAARYVLQMEQAL